MGSALSYIGLMPVNVSLISITELNIGGVGIDFETVEFLFTCNILSAVLKLLGVCTHLQTENWQLYKSYLNCGAKAPWGWFSLPHDEF